jgi:hypothetical protein
MIDFLYLAGLFSLSFVISTLLIRLGIPRLVSGGAGGKTNPLPESVTSRPFDPKSVGFWIGLCETLLTFVLVCEGEYGALAIIIGAKEFVRREKLQEEPSYYLLGTLVNLCVAVLFALAAKVFVLSHAG